MLFSYNSYRHPKIEIIFNLGGKMIFNIFQIRQGGFGHNWGEGSWSSDLSTSVVTWCSYSTSWMISSYAGDIHDSCCSSNANAAISTLGKCISACLPWTHLEHCGNHMLTSARRRGWSPMSVIRLTWYTRRYTRWTGCWCLVIWVLSVNSWRELP